MKAYFDFNIYASIENEDFTTESVLNELHCIESIDILYSVAHIYETDNITASDESVKQNRVRKRLSIISEVTNNKYLYHKLPSNEVVVIQEKPLDAYNTTTESINTKPVFNSFMNLVSNEQKIEFRRLLGIDNRLLNNYQPENVIEHLNTKISGLGMSFIEMIEYGVTLHPDGRSFGLHNRIAGIFELLDMLGYWTDKYTPKSNVARLWDSNHCYFASFCDYFISNDKRTRNKAKVVYDIYNIGTVVISSDGKN